VIDYGFSKTKAESIKMWTHDRVLYDAVRIIRLVRPLVITSVFVGGPSDGHGNHQTAGAMAREAFQAAGDPNIFPDQIRAGLRPWTPLKDYARVPLSHEGGSNLTVNLQIPEGTYDPVLGLSYVQIAREGLGYQKSQNGGGFIPKAGQVLSDYHRFASVMPARDEEKSFFDGIDTSLFGIATLATGGEAGFLKVGLARINAAVEDAIAQFSASQPERTAPALAAGLKETSALLAEVGKSALPGDAKYNIHHELEIKRIQFNNALAEALGLSIAATVAPETEPSPLMALFMGDPETFRIAIPGQTFGVKVHVVRQSPAEVALVKTSVEASQEKQAWTISATSTETPAAALVENRPVDARFTVTAPDEASITRPYFSRPDIEQSYYDVDDNRFLGLPFAPYPLAGWAEFRYNGVPIRIGQTVQTIKRVTGEGLVFEPLAVGPAMGVSISPQAGIVPLEARSFPVTTVIHSNAKGRAEGIVQLALPEGWKSEPSSATFAVSEDGQDQSVTFVVTPADLAQKRYQITAVCEYKGRRYTEGYEVVGYPALRPYFLYKPATYRLRGVDVTVAPKLNVGYVMGSGDDVPSSLEHLGVRVTSLSPSDVATGELSRFDAIVFGVRAYAARTELRTHNSRILAYVHNGGVLIVQYNTPEFDHNYGPYPYVMGGEPEEVTDEASKMKILEPSNPIFTWPNKISEADFDGWVEEREFSATVRDTAEKILIGSKA
jgi:hypothetical protein